MFYRATQIKTYSWDNAQVILVGNKCDLEDDRLVPTEDGQRLAEELGKTNSLLFVYLKLHFCPLYIMLREILEWCYHICAMCNFFVTCLLQKYQISI